MNWHAATSPLAHSLTIPRFEGPLSPNPTTTYALLATLVRERASHANVVGVTPVRFATASSSGLFESHGFEPVQATALARPAHYYVQMDTGSHGDGQPKRGYQLTVTREAEAVAALRGIAGATRTGSGTYHLVRVTAQHAGVVTPREVHGEALRDVLERVGGLPTPPPVGGMAARRPARTTVPSL